MSTYILRTYHLLEPLTIVRASTNGRTIEGMIAPFDVEITTQEIEASGRTRNIREVLRSSAFKQSIQRRGTEIPLTFYHPNVLNPYADQQIVGKPVGWKADAKGQRATFRMFNHAKADEALEMVDEGMIADFSIGAQVIPAHTKQHLERGKLPLMERFEVNLMHVALVPSGGYPGAEVENIRSEVDTKEVGTPKLDALSQYLENLKSRR